MYSKEFAQLVAPPAFAQSAGCVIDVDEDHVEEELAQIMNLETVLPDEKLIALVEGMLSFLRSWSAQFQC